jgi:hypothetical protein
VYGSRLWRHSASTQASAAVSIAATAHKPSLAASAMLGSAVMAPSTATMASRLAKIWARQCAISFKGIMGRVIHVANLSSMTC